MKRSSKKGFTLAELLIVIAIIAILVAIMIPVFGAQLNKAKAAAELANVRAAYAEILSNAMLGGNNLTDVAANAKIDGRQLADATKETGTVVTFTPGAAGEEGTITVTYSGISGEFKTDADVVITSDGTNAITAETTLTKTPA